MYDELIKRLRYCSEETSGCGLCALSGNCVLRVGLILQAADAIEELQQISAHYEETAHDYFKDVCYYLERVPKWIPVTERLPECDLGAEVGNIEWISNGMVHAGCFGRGGKYRDAYFRTWTDAGEGMDAKDADCWRAVTLPEPPKEEKYD